MASTRKSWPVLQSLSQLSTNCATAHTKLLLRACEKRTSQDKQKTENQNSGLDIIFNTEL